MEVQQSILEVVRVVEMQAASQKIEIQTQIPKKWIFGDK